MEVHASKTERTHDMRGKAQLLLADCNLTRPARPALLSYLSSCQFKTQVEHMSRSRSVAPWLGCSRAPFRVPRATMGPRGTRATGNTRYQEKLIAKVSTLHHRRAFQMSPNVKRPQTQDTAGTRRRDSEVGEEHTRHSRPVTIFRSGLRTKDLPSFHRESTETQKEVRVKLVAHLPTPPCMVGLVDNSYLAAPGERGRDPAQPRLPVPGSLHPPPPLLCLSIRISALSPRIPLLRCSYYAPRA